MGRERYIYLLRHGELYEAGGAHRCLGRTDVPLTEEGEHQAQKIAGWFQDKQIDHIFCSPLSRCIKTAQIVKALADRNTEVVIRNDLRELEAGEWENLSFKEIKERYPEEYEERGRHLGTYAPPGGESFEQAGKRFGQCLEKIRKEKTDGNLLIVAHAGVIRGYLCSLLDMSPDDIFVIPQPYVGISVLKETDGCLRVQRAGWRPLTFLDDDEIHRIYEKCATPLPVIRHMEAVAAYLDGLKAHLGEADYDWNALRKAALLHDICRTEKDHARVSADYLKKDGYEEIENLVRQHHSGEYSVRLRPEDLLFYADKRVQEDRVVSVEERFAASLKKCSTPEALTKHQKLYEKTKYIEDRLRELCIV